MTRYDVIKGASKKEMAIILAALAKGMAGDAGPTWQEILGVMQDFLDEEVPA